MCEVFKVATPAAGNGYDLSKLTKEQYLQFKNAFVDKCMYNNVYMENTDQKAIQMILNVICMLLCKRLPEGIVPFKTDDLVKKIKLLPLPKGLGFDQLPGLSR
jgi:hypothetical protein